MKSRVMQLFGLYELHITVKVTGYCVDVGLEG